MEKKIAVEVDGRTVYIMEHMLQDATRFGASVIKRQVKEPPKELTIVKKTILPPKLEIPEVPDELKAKLYEVPIMADAVVKKPIGRKKKVE